MIAALAVAELFVLAVTFSASIVGLPLVTDDLASSMEPETLLSVTLAVGAMTVIVTSPFFGALSDLADRRLGSRSSVLYGGAVVGVLGMAAIPIADSPLSLIGAWIVAQAGYAAVLAALYGLVPTILGEADWPRATAWFAAAATGAVVVGAGSAAALPKDPWTLMTALPVATLAVVATVSRRLQAKDSQSSRRSLSVPSPVQRPREFRLLWGQRFVAQCSWVATALYGVNLLQRRAELTENAAASVVGIASVTAAVSGAVVAGLLAVRIGERWGPRAGLWLGLGAIAVANLGLSLAASPAAYVASTTMAGIGVGLFNATDLALVIHFLRRGHEGRDLGVFAVARMIPQALIPGIAPLFFGIGSDAVGHDRGQNYWLFYVCCAFVTVVAMVLVRRLPSRLPSHTTAAVEYTP